MVFNATKALYILLMWALVMYLVRSSSVVNNNIVPISEDITKVVELREILRQVNQSTNLDVPGQITAAKPRPCSCGGGLCSCCSRLLYDNWKQKACVNVTYDPDEFSFTTKVLMNDRILYTRTVSGKNPRPVCVPIPRIPAVRACVRFYNIYFQRRNVHACINMEAKFSGTTVFKVGMDCIRFGADGVAVVKPEDGIGLGQIEFLPTTNDEGEDEYDDSADDDDDDDDDNDDDDYY